MVVVTECQEFITHELGAVVGDDRVWNPEPEDYVGEEKHGLLRLDLGDGSSLDPLGELVDRYQQ